jgi:chromosome segregation ATPase
VSPLLVVGITGVLGGGMFGGIASLISSRATAKNFTAQQKAIDVKLPAEVDSVVVSGAEQAVLSMGRALDAAERRIAELERREIEAERIIAELRRELATLRVQIDDCNTALDQAEAKVTALSARLSAIDHTD